MKSTCRIKLHFNERQIANIVYLALEPETRAIISERSDIKAEKINQNEIILSIKTSDITAARAVINSYLRWVDSILNILKLLEIS